MKKFLTTLKDAVVALGFQEKFTKQQLTADEQNAIIKAYEEASKTSFKDDLKSFQDEQAVNAENEALANAFRSLASSLSTEMTGKEDANDIIKTINSNIAEMKSTITKLSARTQDDSPVAKMPASGINAFGVHTKDHAFGCQSDFFATSKRYNRIAVTGLRKGTATDADAELFQKDFKAYCEALSERHTQLKQTGLIDNVVKGTIDYSQISSDTDLNQYLVRRQDALIARIAQLPSADSIFPRRSNVQDGDVLTNVLFTELSQAYQSGHVTKGAVTFEPEKAKVDKCMVKFLIEDMSWIETSYLGYLNTNGSDPVKWNMIEWLVLQMATQLTKEETERNILGYRIAPNANVAGNSIFGATGVIHRIISYYESKKMLPFFDSELASYTSANIGDVLTAFMDKLSSVVDDPENYTVYMNAKHRSWFNNWYRNKFGVNANYNGIEYKVPDYDNPIRFVPGMKNISFIFATYEGNLQTLENVPGEKTNFMFQRDLEEVIVASYFKSGVAADYVGEKFDSLTALKAANATKQMLFCNWPVSSLAANATTVDGSKEILVMTPANTQATALTDILNADPKMVYRIECGSTANATTITKSGKFSNIVSAWTPTAVGDYIKVRYDSDAAKFIEVARG